MSAEGILNIDKPAGITSHDVVQQVRRLTRIRRVGHTGTLDPLATGVLVVCLGRATRLAEYVVGLPKVYETTVRLGQTTNTYDAEGSIVEEQPVEVSEADIRRALSRFQGEIAQRAPLYSAIKREGQPLYKLARQGVAVEAPERTVTIYNLSLVDWTPPQLQLRVSCSTGTYIRSLAHDVGQVLGCGGHVQTLRRLAVGHFDAATAAELLSLDADNWRAQLQPADVAVAHLPRLNVSAEEGLDLLAGKRLPAPSERESGSQLRVYERDDVFIGLVAVEDGELQPRKMFPRAG